MGVPGLTTFIYDKSSLYLSDYKLCDTYLVVDGSCLASKLFDLTERDSVFGVDYDEFYKVVHDFFQNLIRCKVSAVVILDGGSEMKKMSTKLKRFENKINTLVNFYNYSNEKFFGLFNINIFVAAVKNLKIPIVYSSFESDIEIAAIARDLKCPVLSYDSDFFIFDVTYILIKSVFNPVEREEVFSNKYRYFIHCQVFNRTNFLNHNGLNASVMPLMAAVLGNDYVSCTAFTKFFNHVRLPDKKLSFNQKKIHGIINWLSTETVESGVRTILSHVQKKNTKKLSQAINMNMKHYCDMAVSESVICQLQKHIKNYSPQFINKNDVSILPPYLNSERLRTFTLDIIISKVAIMPLGVEDLRNESIVKTNLDLIKKMFSLVTSIGKNSKELKIYTRQRRSVIHTKVLHSGPEIHLTEILKMRKEDRVKFLYDFLNINDEIQKTISILGDDLALLVISLIKWINVVKHSIKLSHIHAFIIMFIANKIVQKRTGYYKNLNEFLKKIPKVFQCTETLTTVNNNNELEKNFNEMQEAVTLEECYTAQRCLIPFRQTLEIATGRDYSISTIHLFTCFQFNLLIIDQINEILGRPLPTVTIQDLYSGTLLYNLQLLIKKERCVESFGRRLFFSTPNLMNIYLFLCEKLCKYYLM